MTKREKILLGVLITVALVMGTFYLINSLYFPRLRSAEAKLSAAEAQILTAKSLSAVKDQYATEIDWLTANEPEPKSAQKAQTDLQNFVETSAKQLGIKVEQQRLQPSVKNEASYYHRSRIQMKVKCTEDLLYRWLDRVHDPRAFRAVTFLRLNPQRDDDTKIDAQLTIEQWFVPEQ